MREELVPSCPWPGLDLHLDLPRLSTTSHQPNASGPLFSFLPVDLPETPVDLVINCLDCHENAFLRDQPWYKAAVDWANQNRAPVLSLDPPVNEMEQEVDAKWSLALGLPLPLSERAGRLYLCDIGIPQNVFQEVGINYHSPFGCKFVIPLHST